MRRDNLCTKASDVAHETSITHERIKVDCIDARRRCRRNTHGMQQCARLRVRVNQRGRTVDEVADAEEHVDRYRLRSAIDRTNTVGNVLNDAHRSDDPEQRMTEQELVVLMTNVTRKRIERAC